MSLKRTLLLNESFQLIEGYLYGLHCPSLIITINKPLPVFENDKLKEIIDNLSLGLNLNAHSNCIRKDILDIFKLCVFKIQEIANWAVFEEAVIIEEENHFTLAIPSIKYGHQQTWMLTQNLANYINSICNGENSTNSLNALLSTTSLMRNIGIQRENVLHFLKAAFKEGIPFLKFPGLVYQFGYGSLSRLLDSSLTEESSQISAALARNKSVTLEVLSDAGIPIPKHVNIKHPSGAVKFANSFGFPIVIKPGDQDGGIGVTVDIQNENEINQAFKKASEFSKNIVVEDHVLGHDYRLVVFRSQLIWAVQRVPAHIIGDGISTIKKLISIENKKKSRDAQSLAPLKPLELSDEAIIFLKKQGADQNSVPKLNEVIYLKKEANIAAGGIPVAVFDKVHEDNRTLAIKAAEILRLDLAGIDLIMPDITKSWRDVGGAICEVNAQPMLGSLTSSHLYVKIINDLIQKKGQAPTNLIINLNKKSGFGKTLKSELDTINIRSCLINGHSIISDAFEIKKETLHELATIRDRKIDVFITEINCKHDLNHGLSFEYIDNLVIIDNANNPKKNKSYIDILKKVLPMCKGEIFFSYKIRIEEKKEISVNKKIKVHEGLSTRQIIALVKNNIKNKLNEDIK
jgi:cyanophycin synthetase